MAGGEHNERPQSACAERRKEIHRFFSIFKVEKEGGDEDERGCF